MRCLACLLALSSTIGLAAEVQTHQVPAELWDRPRTARAIVEQDAIKRAVSATLAQPAAQLVIRHGIGPDSLSQAEELRSWLGALAIDTRRIVLRNDPAPGASMQIEIVP